MNSAMLTISARPDLLDRCDQAGRAVGEDQAWRSEPTSDQIAAEFDPVLLGLPCSQPDADQLPMAIFVDGTTRSSSFDATVTANQSSFAGCSARSSTATSSRSSTTVSRDDAPGQHRARSGLHDLRDAQSNRQASDAIRTDQRQSVRRRAQPHDLWIGALERYPILDDFEIEPYYLLQVVALRTGTSCKRSSVLAIEPDDIDQEWDDALADMAGSDHDAARPMRDPRPEVAPLQPDAHPARAAWRQVSADSGPVKERHAPSSCGGSGAHPSRASMRARPRRWPSVTPRC